MNITLKKIRKHSPCTDRWEKLLKSLGKTKVDNAPLSLITVLDSNGLDDAVWCLRALEGYDKEIRLFAVWCARQVQHLMKDGRSLRALDVAEAFAYGTASREDLDAARLAAWDAAWAVDWDAAWVAAGAVAVPAARDAARGARGAVAAVWDAGSGFGSAAWDAAWADAAAQEKEFRRVFGGRLK
jgi:hypothetical protein